MDRFKRLWIWIDGTDRKKNKQTEGERAEYGRAESTF